MAQDIRELLKNDLSVPTEGLKPNLWYSGKS